MLGPDRVKIQGKLSAWFAATERKRAAQVGKRGRRIGASRQGRGSSRSSTAGSLGEAVAGSPVGAGGVAGGEARPASQPGPRVLRPAARLDRRARVRPAQGDGAAVGEKGAVEAVGRPQPGGAGSREITTAARRQSSSKARRSSTSATGRPPARSRRSRRGRSGLRREGVGSSASRPSPSALSHCSATKAGGAPEQDEPAVSAAQRRAGPSRSTKRSARGCERRQREPRRHGREAEQAQRRRQQGEEEERRARRRPARRRRRPGRRRSRRRSPLTQAETSSTAPTAAPISDQTGRSRPKG